MFLIYFTLISLFLQSVDCVFDVSLKPYPSGIEETFLYVSSFSEEMKCISKVCFRLRNHYKAFNYPFMGKEVGFAYSNARFSKIPYEAHSIISVSTALSLLNVMTMEQSHILNFDYNVAYCDPIIYRRSLSLICSEDRIIMVNITSRSIVRTINAPPGEKLLYYNAFTDEIFMLWSNSIMKLVEEKFVLLTAGFTHVVFDDYIYAVSSRGIVALSFSDEKPLWVNNITISSDIVQFSKHLSYLCLGLMDSIHFFSSVTGDLLWSYYESGLGGQFVLGNTVGLIFSSPRGDVITLDRGSGEQLSRVKFSSHPLTLRSVDDYAIVHTPNAYLFTAHITDYVDNPLSDEFFFSALMKLESNYIFVNNTGVFSFTEAAQGIFTSDADGSLLHYNILRSEQEVVIHLLWNNYEHEYMLLLSSSGALIRTQLVHDRCTLFRLPEDSLDDSLFGLCHTFVRKYSKSFEIVWETETFPVSHSNYIVPCSNGTIYIFNTQPPLLIRQVLLIDSKTGSSFFRGLELDPTDVWFRGLIGSHVALCRVHEFFVLDVSGEKIFSFEVFSQTLEALVMLDRYVFLCCERVEESPYDMPISFLQSLKHFTLSRGIIDPEIVVLYDVVVNKVIARYPFTLYQNSELIMIKNGKVYYNEGNKPSKRSYSYQLWWRYMKEELSKGSPPEDILSYEKFSEYYANSSENGRSEYCSSDTGLCEDYIFDKDFFDEVEDSHDPDLLLIHANVHTVRIFLGVNGLCIWTMTSSGHPKIFVEEDSMTLWIVDHYKSYFLDLGKIVRRVKRKLSTIYPIMESFSHGGGNSIFSLSAQNIVPSKLMFDITGGRSETFSSFLHDDIDSLVESIGDPSNLSKNLNWKGTHTEEDTLKDSLLSSTSKETFQYKLHGRRLMGSPTPFLSRFPEAVIAAIQSLFAADVVDSEPVGRKGNSKGQSPAHTVRRDPRIEIYKREAEERSRMIFSFEGRPTPFLQIFFSLLSARSSFSLTRPTIYTLPINPFQKLNGSPQQLQFLFLSYLLILVLLLGLLLYSLRSGVLGLRLSRRLRRSKFFRSFYRNISSNQERLRRLPCRDHVKQLINQLRILMSAYVWGKKGGYVNCDRQNFSLSSILTKGDHDDSTSLREESNSPSSTLSSRHDAGSHGMSRVLFAPSDFILNTTSTPPASGSQLCRSDASFQSSPGRNAISSHYQTQRNISVNRSLVDKSKGYFDSSEGSDIEDYYSDESTSTDSAGLNFAIVSSYVSPRSLTNDGLNHVRRNLSRPHSSTKQMRMKGVKARGRTLLRNHEWKQRTLTREISLRKADRGGFLCVEANPLSAQNPPFESSNRFEQTETTIWTGSDHESGCEHYVSRGHGLGERRINKGLKFHPRKNRGSDLKRLLMKKRRMLVDRVNVSDFAQVDSLDDVTSSFERERHSWLRNPLRLRSLSSHNSRRNSGFSVNSSLMQDRSHRSSVMKFFRSRSSFNSSNRAKVQSNTFSGLQHAGSLLDSPQMLTGPISSAAGVDLCSHPNILPSENRFSTAVESPLLTQNLPVGGSDYMNLGLSAAPSSINSNITPENLNSNAIIMQLPESSSNISLRMFPHFSPLFRAPVPVIPEEHPSSFISSEYESDSSRESHNMSELSRSNSHNLIGSGFDEVDIDLTAGSFIGTH